MGALIAFDPGQAIVVARSVPVQPVATLPQQTVAARTALVPAVEATGGNGSNGVNGDGRRNDTARRPLPTADDQPASVGIRFDKKIDRFVVVIWNRETNKIRTEIPDKAEQERIAFIREQIGKLLNETA